MKRKYLTYSLLFLLFTVPVYTQSQWSLDDCIAYAITHNLGQKTQEYNAAISKEIWKQTKRDLIPSIGVGLPGYYVSYGRSIDPITNNVVDTRYVSGVNGSLSSSIVLFESFKKWNTLTYQKIQFENSKHTALQSKFDLAFSVMNAFNDVLFNEGALSILEEQQSINLLQHKMIKSKVKLGLKAKSDLYEIESILSSDELSVLNAENKLNEAKLNLLQEMNLTQNDIILSTPIDNDSISSSFNSMDVEHIYEQSIQSLPNLQIGALNVKAATKNLAISRASFFPRISLMGSVSTGFSPNRLDVSGNQMDFWDQVKSNQNKSIGLSLSIPIFGNGRTWSDFKKTKLKKMKAEVEFEQQKLKVYKEIQMLTQRISALVAEEIVNSKKLTLKELTYSIARKKFEKGLINLYDLQTANRELMVAKIEQLRMKIQLSIQKRTLDFYKGEFYLPTTNLTLN